MTAPRFNAMDYADDPLPPEKVIANCRTKADAVEAYAEAISAAANREHVEWARLNGAIRTRWGLPALSRIKARAWARVRGGLVTAPRPLPRCPLCGDEPVVIILDPPGYAVNCAIECRRYHDHLLQVAARTPRAARAKWRRLAGGSR